MLHCLIFIIIIAITIVQSTLFNSLHTEWMNARSHGINIGQRPGKGVGAVFEIWYIQRTIIMHCICFFISFRGLQSIQILLHVRYIGVLLIELNTLWNGTDRNLLYYFFSVGFNRDESVSFVTSIFKLITVLIKRLSLPNDSFERSK